MEEKIEFDAQLCAKYKIKRPPHDAAALNELTSRMEEEFLGHPNWNKSWMKECTLVRFLKAFLTVEKTVEALFEYFDWRVEEKVDEILTVDVEKDEGLLKEKKKERDYVFVEQTDRCGRPILVVNVRKHNKNHNDYDRCTVSRALLQQLIFNLSINE